MSSTEERRIKLTLHYDGAGFHGWQVQPSVRTVQAELETALSRLADRPVTVIAAGRTDRGVHATGQVAAASVPARWTPAALRRSLNAILPADIWVAAAETVAPDFHARYDAVARSYTYRVGTADAARSPFRRRWCWPLAEPLDRAALDAAAAAVVGEHSFRAFAKAGQEERGDRCTVYRARWTAWGEIGVVFHITANRFLHHMVRYLVGTMVDAARGRRPVEDVAAMLEGAPALETSPPAPPEGLFLTHVAYSPAEPEEEEIDANLPG
ncbi:MAG TPA: tRNA pseudouridine(38-40) synthase TruA [Longimicrobiales bacterium]